MSRALVLTLVLCCQTSYARSQCPGIDVNIPSEVCRETNFLIENNLAELSVEWDLCPFDLQTIPSLSKVMNTGLSSTIDFALAEENGVFYGFAVDATSNSLLRLDFGNSRDNIPTTVNLGNIDGQFQFPNSIAIISQAGNWLGIVANGANEKIILVDFGNALSNVPAATVLYNRTGGGFVSIDVASTSTEGRALVIAEFSSQQVSIVNYPQGFLMSSDVQQTISIPGSTPIDVQVVRQCTNWRALVLSFDDHKIYNLDFGDSFTGMPVISQYDLTMDFEPYRISLVREGQSFHGFVTTTAGGIHRLDFGNDVDKNPTLVTMGSFGVLSNSRSLFIDSRDGLWRGFTINFSDGDLFRFSFRKDCGVTPSYTTGNQAEARYTNSGSQRIDATVFASDGSTSTYAHVIQVADLPAPDFSISKMNSCVNHEVNFRLDNIQGEIAGYEWNFGDGNSSALADPVHTFSSADTYTITVQATGVNGCLNRKQIAAAIFYEPISEFQLPSSTPLCTGQTLEFLNTSQYDAASEPSWRWLVNSVEVSTERELRFAFSDEGPHSVALVVGIPGCEDTSYKDVGPLLVGPMVDFDYSGICQGDTTSFRNLSTGDLSSLTWDFGDGNSSTSPNPSNDFSEAGPYDVTLTALGTTGCVVQKTERIQIMSRPVLDFDISGPPSACSGVPARFINSSQQSEIDRIVNWIWNFNDENDRADSGEASPEHVFANPGNYRIVLSASTEYQCENSIEKEITIHESPSSEFSFSPACDDVPVAFTASGTNVQHWYWSIGTSYYLTSSPSHTFRSAGAVPVRLEVVAFNGCKSSLTKSIQVPLPLIPEFTAVKNCVGHEAFFTDRTKEEATDPIISRFWEIDPGGHFSGSNAQVIFPREGSALVQLTIQTASGCSYQSTGLVDVLPPPQASFLASPTTGGYPLEVTFTNTSTHATNYNWNFSDGGGISSSQISPTYTFLHQGAFNVELTAYNEQLCESSFTTVISALEPYPDAAIELITISANPDGTSRLIITLHNKGNTFLKELPVDIDFGGNLRLTQLVHETIAPGTKYNLILNPTIKDAASLRYLCASIELGGDSNEAQNKMCVDFESKLYVFDIYPNPVSNSLTVEWIAGAARNMRITLSDALGRTAFSTQLMPSGGFNREALSIRDLTEGIYYLHIEDGVMRKSQRVVVTGNR